MALREARNRASFRGVLGRAWQRLDKWRWSPWFVCGGLLVVSHARAEEEAVRVAYSAPEVCPDEALFVERVRVRTPHGRFADPGELARAFNVSLSGAASGSFTGQLEFVDRDGQLARRTVTGATCDEVVSSLALIMALSIDDRVTQAESATNQPAPSPPLAALGQPTKKTTPSPGAGPSARPRVESQPHRPLRWDVGANVGVWSWVTPSPAFAFGAFAELGSRGTVPRSARLSAFAARQTELASVSRAEFATTWLRLEACPVGVAVPAPFSIAPCAAFDAGVLHAAGEPSSVISSASSQSIFWAAGALLLRFGWLVEERLSLGLDGELGAPLIRHDFRFDNPNTPLFSVPALGAGVKVGVGLRFP